MGTAGRDLSRSVHGRAGRDDRQRRAAGDAARTAPRHERASVGCERLPADAGRADLAGRAPGRPFRPQAGLPDRRADLLDGEPGRRGCAQWRRAAGGAGGAGGRRGAAGARDAEPADGGVHRAAGAKASTCRVEHDSCQRRRVGRVPRRRAHRRCWAGDRCCSSTCRLASSCSCSAAWRCPRWSAGRARRSPSTFPER